MSPDTRSEFLSRKKAAYKFLKGLEAKLNCELPAPSAMKPLMANIAAQGTSPSKIRENIFLYYVLPLIFCHMQTVSEIGSGEARESLLCEYHRKAPHLACGNAFRRPGYPFSKQRVMSASAIMESWTKSPSAPPANQAYPDFGLRAPFPYSIVFDAKYFMADSQNAASVALVEGAYETAFYRGLPYSPPRKAD